MHTSSWTFTACGLVRQFHSMPGSTQLSCFLKNSQLIRLSGSLEGDDPFDGIAGSVPATITADEAMEHNYVMDIATNTRIQNKKKLGVVALLIDKATGKVVNAAKFKFEKDSGSGQGVASGDANGDGKVDAADVVEIVNFILNNPSAEFNQAAADVNRDSVVDISDAVGVVNIILNK